MNQKPVLVPRSLVRGDKVAFVAPAGIARAADIFLAVRAIEQQGWKPVVMPHALGRCGSSSGSVEERLDDFESALLDPEIRAIICARGGYGAIHLLDRLDRLPLRDDPKWLVGFSDISALHALMNRHRIASIHGPMAKYIAADGGCNPDFMALCRILRGEVPEYVIPGHPLNRVGSCEAPFAGGNMAVLGGLTGTPFDCFRPGMVLFIEDIAEPIYKIERQLYQLRMSGILPELSGLLVGAFTDYRPDANHASMEQMIRQMVEDYDYPVAFGIPAGHGGRSLPLIGSVRVKLHVGKDKVLLKF